MPGDGDEYEERKQMKSCIVAGGGIRQTQGRVRAKTDRAGRRPYPIRPLNAERFKMKSGDVIKSNSLDRNENISTQGKLVETTVCNVEDVHLFDKEMEEIIAPKTRCQPQRDDVKGRSRSRD